MVVVVEFVVVVAMFEAMLVAAASLVAGVAAVVSVVVVVVLVVASVFSAFLPQAATERAAMATPAMISLRIRKSFKRRSSAKPLVGPSS